ncbi:MAG: hypothetical protein LBP59_10490 [Planctomycetaceae bacterium]|jgi:hypothetical protein|nr:hypothetical protein [Planctomycetaceae bacterium]
MENVDRSQLLADLELLKPGLTDKEVIEQSDCIAFDGASKWAYTFNENIACFVPLDLGITGAVVAEPFFKVLSKLTDATVTLEQRESELIIRGDKVEAGIKCDPNLMLPIDILERSASAVWRPLPDKFATAVVIVEDCVSQSNDDFQLSSIHITDNYIESATLHQLCRVRWDFGIDGSCLVRHGHLRSILKMGVTEYSVTSNWLHFRNIHGLHIDCRRHNVSYDVPVDPIINKKRSGVDVTFPDGLRDSIETAFVFSKENMRGSDEITVTFNPERSQIEMKGEGLYGWFKSKYPVAYSGASVTFKVHPKLLLDLLGKFDICTVCEDCILIDDGVMTYITEVKKA